MSPREPVLENPAPVPVAADLGLPRRTDSIASSNSQLRFLGAMGELPGNRGTRLLVGVEGIIPGGDAEFVVGAYRFFSRSYTSRLHLS